MLCSSCLFIFSLDQSLCVEWTTHSEPIHFSIDPPPYKSLIYKLHKIHYTAILSYLGSIERLCISSKFFLIMRALSSSLDCYFRKLWSIFEVQLQYLFTIWWVVYLVSPIFLVLYFIIDEMMLSVSQNSLDRGRDK